MHAYHISQMRCQNEAQHIEELLSDTPGVHEVEVDLEHRLVRVISGDPNGHLTLRRVLVDSGFPPDNC